MNTSDHITFLELHIIQKIIADETWLEGERRGRRVDPHDPAVVATVCEIVLRIGAELRASLITAHQARLKHVDQDNAMAA